MDKVTVLGRDASGRAVAEFTSSDGDGQPVWSFRYYLTDCCAADATGVCYGTGVACRACYAELPADFGGRPSDARLAVVFGDGISLAQYREGVTT